MILLFFHYADYQLSFLDYFLKKSANIFHFLLYKRRIFKKVGIRSKKTLAKVVARQATSNFKVYTAKMLVVLRLFVVLNRLISLYNTAYQWVTHNVSVV